MDTISLLIVEDHAVYSSALQGLLEGDDKIRIAGVARSADECLGKLVDARVDLVLVDVGLPRIDGISLVKLIREQYPNLPCVMISAYLSAEYVQHSLEAGARGYLIKDNPADILEGIWSVMNGRIYISQELGGLDLGFLAG